MADADRLSKDPAEQNIQEFAETAMKEMLSWYGYERRESPERCRRRPGSGAGSPPAGAAPASPVTDGSVSPRPVSPVTAALANDPNCKRTPVVCSWCNKLGAQLYTMGSKAFCSEPCFSQSRVANFRKTKLCDWCKNIRDSLNIEYVNGDQQLQFCSESCLNAYKMNIFCKETEAHIQMLPQLRELVSRSSKETLITPDMWLRDRAPPVDGEEAHRDEGVAGERAADRAGGGPAVSDRRRLRRPRPDPLRPPLRGVRARSHTMPHLELREQRARRRPSAPTRPPPPPPAATTAAAATAAAAAAGSAGQPTAAAPPPQSAAPPQPALLWQRYHLLRPGAPPLPPLPVAPLPPVTVLLPTPVMVPVPVPIPIPVPESVCHELLARCRAPAPAPDLASAPPAAASKAAAPAPAECPILKRELEKESASGSDAEGLDLTVRKRKTDHPRKIKMEEDDFD